MDELSFHQLEEIENYIYNLMIENEYISVEVVNGGFGRDSVVEHMKQIIEFDEEDEEVVVDNVIYIDD